MALIRIGFFSQALGMCTSCDVILPQYSQSLIGMKTAEEVDAVDVVSGASVTSGALKEAVKNALAQVK